jgi:hypothetical protein
LFCLLALVLMNFSTPRRVEPCRVESHAAMVGVAASPVLRAEATAHKANRVSTQLPKISDTPTSDRNASARLREKYGKLPLSFEPNQGQTDGHVKFLSRGKGYTMFLTSEGAVMELRAPGTENKNPERVGERSPSTQQHIMEPGRPAFLRMKLVGANQDARVEGREELPGKSNYFLGNDPSQWRINVPNYSRVKYKSIYPGVDLVYYGNQGQLESDFIVAAGADIRAIQLGIEGAKRLRINRNGDLEIKMHEGEVVLGKPVVYQSSEGGTEKHIVAGRYTVNGKQEVGFAVGSYDKTEPLIIDPVLRYSTYLGGSNLDDSTAVAPLPRTLKVALT